MTRRRRSTDTVRAELLESARYLFARRGYAGASTKEIATRAGTFESSLYTHYGSKAALFSAAVIQPFTEFVDSFKDTLTERADEPEEVLVRAFVEDLYDRLAEHQDAVAAVILVMREPDAGEAAAAAQASIDAMFAELHAIGRRRDAAAGHASAGRPIIERLMVGLVVASTAFSPWLLAGYAESGEAVKDAITEILVSGVLSDLRTR